MLQKDKIQASKGATYGEGKENRQKWLLELDGKC